MREHVPLRDMALPGIDPSDRRSIEVVATGLPIARGIPIAIDATLISPLHADGKAWANAAAIPGVSFQRAYRNKERTYLELRDSNAVKLVIAAMETGGRLCTEALELLDAAATAKAQAEPKPIRKQAAGAWRARWITLLAGAPQDALAATLVDEGARLLDANGQEPCSVDTWLDGDWLSWAR